MKLINDCKSGIISVILFTYIDRWFRSVKDYYLVQEQIGDVPWKSIWENYETTTSDSMLRVNIMLSVSEAEAVRISEKIKSALAYKKANGEYQGVVPFGFKTENKKLVVNEDERETVDKIFQTYLMTYSCTKVREAIADRRKLSRVSICRILKSERYVGEFITQAQHDHIVKHFEKHLRKGNNRTYLFSGLLICPKCGHPISGTFNGNTKGYRCHFDDCKSFYTSEKKIEKQCLERIGIELDKATAEYSVKRKSGHSADRKKLIDKMDRLKELYVDGDISKEVYLKRKDDLECKLNLIPNDEYTTLPTLPKGWREIYNSLTDESKQSFWRSVLSSILLTEDKQIDSFIFLQF